MTTRQKSKSNKKRNKRIRNLIFAVILLLISTAVSYMYFLTGRYKDSIYPGVIIQGVDLSGKNKEEAVNILSEKYSNPLQKKKISIKTPNKTYTINLSDLNPKYNIEEKVDEAISYGKDLNIFSKYKLIKKPASKEYNLQFTYDDKLITDTIKKVSEDVNKEPVDATITRGNGGFNVTEDQNGYKLDSDKLSKDIASKINANEEGDIVIEASIKEIKAKITADALKKIDSKLSSFSTSFATSSEGRCTNISLATRSINGTVLMPGDTFSFNGTVGERTKERGYKEAGVIVNQKLDSGLGGGICQVSSTLYNALIRANIKMTERTHHTIPVAYVELGSDATVDWGNIDLKFKNTFDYPIYIEGYTSNKNVYFNIYSNSALAKRTYTITSEVYDVIESKTEYINDSSMKEGQTEVVKSPHSGYRVRTYRNIYENGKFIKKELVTNDYYIPINGVIKRGTKK